MQINSINNVNFGLKFSPNVEKLIQDGRSSIQKKQTNGKILASNLKNYDKTVATISKLCGDENVLSAKSGRCSYQLQLNTPLGQYDVFTVDNNESFNVSTLRNLRERIKQIINI